MQEVKGEIGPAGIVGEESNAHEFIQIRMASPEESRAKIASILAKQARNQAIIALTVGGACIVTGIAVAIKLIFFS